MSSFLADQTVEKVPVAGVYDSSNAVVYLAGLALLRVESIRAVISNNISRYPEVGSREQQPFRGHDRVSCTINRAYVNGAEWRLALGVDPSKVRPGTPGVMVGNVDGEYNLSESGVNLPAITTIDTENSYPIKTRIEMELNKNQGWMTDVNTGLVSQVGAKSWLVLTGILIDTVGLNFNNRGLITSGPIVSEGEHAFFKIEKF